MGRGAGKRTLADFNFGKTATRRRTLAGNKVKPQVNIIVEKKVESAKSKTSWVVKVKYRSYPDDPSRDPGYAVMPMDFPLLRIARQLASAIGIAYHDAGCAVSIDLSGKHHWRMD